MLDHEKKRRLRYAILLGIGAVLLGVAGVALVRLRPFLTYCTGAAGAVIARQPALRGCGELEAEVVEHQIAADLALRLPDEATVTFETDGPFLVVTADNVQLIILRRHVARACDQADVVRLLDDIRRDDASIELADCYEFWKKVANTTTLHLWDVLWRSSRQEVARWEVLARAKLEDPYDERGVVLIECDSTRAVLRLGTRNQLNRWHATVWNHDVVFGMHIRGTGNSPLVMDDVVRMIGSIKVDM